MIEAIILNLNYYQKHHQFMENQLKTGEGSLISLKYLAKNTTQIPQLDLLTFLILLNLQLTPTISTRK